MSWSEIILPALVIVPALLAVSGLLFRSVRGALWFNVASTLAIAVLAGLAGYGAVASGRLVAANGWLMMDALSAYHMFVMMLVFVLSAFYSVSYFLREAAEGNFDTSAARRYVALYLGSLAAMMLVLVSNNLGLMWVGIEATTLLTAFLIIIHSTPASLEAMWKYLLMCSVGVAFAFTGTILVAASTAKAHMTGADLLHWTRLMESAGGLDQSLLKMGFIFLVVGFGTKAGLAPMHNWLPDAHSQAPAPVSAIFSGFLLNAALYCILRYIPILDLATGNSAWAHDILIVFGVASILIAAAFIVAQHDVKRLLAYHSVEHLGIIAFGAGVGGLGAFAALFHILNHSLCKALSFFCAGTLGQIYGTHDMRRMTGVVRKSPVWGIGLLVSLLALIGVAPFALFLSEFLILKAAWNAAAYWTMSFFIVGLGVVFVGALRHAIPMAWEAPPDGIPETRASGIGVLVVAAPICVLLVLGLWMPEPLRNVLTQAIAVLGEKI